MNGFRFILSFRRALPTSRHLRLAAVSVIVAVTGAAAFAPPLVPYAGIGVQIRHARVAQSKAWKRKRAKQLAEAGSFQISVRVDERSAWVGREDRFRLRRLHRDEMRHLALPQQLVERGHIAGANRIE